jgi:hypothetical protein
MNQAPTRARAAQRAKSPLTGLFSLTTVALIGALLPGPAPAQAADAADGGAMPRTFSASAARPSPRFVAKAASASASAASAPTLVFHPQRVVVTTVEAWSDLAALSQRATAATGLRVRDLTIQSPHRVAMTLVCADAIRCDEALTRLKSASSFASQVEVDNRRMVPHRPTPDQSR